MPLSRAHIERFAISVRRYCIEFKTSVLVYNNKQIPARIIATSSDAKYLIEHKPEIVIGVYDETVLRQYIINDLEFEFKKETVC